MTTTPSYHATAAHVTIDATALHITLADGRELSVPLAHWPFLASATPAQRADFELLAGNEAIWWNSLDEGLEIAHLLGEPIASPPSA